MKTFPILFSRTETGAVQSWQIIVEKNRFKVISGQTDGLKVESNWTVCKGKNLGKANETSSEEQAYKEAESKWKKKLKTGYTEDLNKIDKCISYVEPMLAKNFEDRLDKINWKKGVFVQNKFNGCRCIATFNGSEVLLKTRKGETYISVPHINQDLLRFFNDYPEAVLDGELFSNDYRQRLNELMSLVRKTKNISSEDLNKSKEMVRFYIYDGYNFEDMHDETPYDERKEWIDNKLPKYSSYYRNVKTDIAYSLEDVRSIFNEYVEDGHEGVIVRIPDSPYENKRSQYLLKWKPLEDDEAIIVDIQEGEGNWAGTGKVMSLKWKDKIFDATFKGTMEECTQFLKDKALWIGKQVKFQYNGLTGLGTPSYARVDINNCDPRK